MNKIVEIIRGNDSYRFFALTLVVSDKYVGGISGEKPSPRSKLGRFIKQAMSKAFINEVSISRTEITINISPAYEGEEGWTLVREHMLPLIKKFFYDAEPEYELRNEAYKFQSTGRWDD